MEAQYPELQFDMARDCLVVWLRWVSMEQPPNPTEPPNQGIRVELKINRNAVLGPTIVSRSELDEPIYLRSSGQRVREVLQSLGDGARVDVQLVIHGSVANAPYAALYHLRDYEGEAIDRATVKATPLLQVQPSTPGDQWHVAGQANLRVRLALLGTRHLRVLKN
jgi:hypothetical protein